MKKTGGRMKRTILSKKKIIFIALFVFAITLFPVRSPSKSIKYVVLEGSPYNRGLYHGKTLKKDIIELIRKWKKYLNRVFKIEADLYIRKFLEKTDFMSAIKKWTPELLEEIKGISDGSGIHFNTIYAYQLLDEIWVHGKDVLDNHHCTGIGVNRQGETPTLAAQNMDIPTFYHGYQILFHIKHEKSDMESFVLSAPGYIGLNGMNNCPVSIHCNALQQLEYSGDGLPVAFIVRGVLMQNSHKKAVDFIHTIKHASGQNYIISGINKSLSFECSAQKVSQYIPFKGAEITYHTNHPLANDNYNTKYLKRLKQKGRTIEQGLYTCYRFLSLEKRLKNRTEPIDIEVIKSTLSSHDTGKWDICNKSTFSCTIMVLSEKPELHITAGPPDTTPFETFKFSKK